MDLSCLLNFVKSGARYKFKPNLVFILLEVVDGYGKASVICNVRVMSSRGEPSLLLLLYSADQRVRRYMARESSLFVFHSAVKLMVLLSLGEESNWSI